MRVTHLISMLALTAAASGCIDELGHEKSEVGELVRDCVVPPWAGVEKLTAPVSLEYPRGSLWIWDRLELTDGRSSTNLAAFVTSADELCRRGPNLLLDSNGNPASLLALSESELLENAARNDGRSLELTATGGFVRDGQGYLFYEHTLRGPGAFDAVNLGSGLCVRKADEPSCERIVVDGSTLLWPGDTRALNSGGLVLSDRAVVVGCKRVADFLRVCTLSGAPLDRLSEPSAYQFMNYFDGWVDDPLRASVITDELGQVTVSATEVGFFATLFDLFDARVYVRLSDDLLSKPFEHRVELFATELPASGFSRGGREHAGLRREQRTLHISYETDDPNAPGLHLASYRFLGKLGGLYQ